MKAKKLKKVLSITLASAMLITAMPTGLYAENEGSTPSMTEVVQDESVPLMVEDPDVTPTEVPELTTAPTEAPEPTTIPETTITPEPTTVPETTITPEPTTVPETTITPEPTSTPESTITPEPTSTPESTITPEPTEAPMITPTAVPTITPTEAPKDPESIEVQVDWGKIEDGDEFTWTGSNLCPSASAVYQDKNIKLKYKLLFNGSNNVEEAIAPGAYTLTVSADESEGNIKLTNNSLNFTIVAEG